jgi:hypothetical protein
MGGLAVFSTAFLLVAIAIRVLRKSDIDNLRLMTGELGPISNVVNKILNVVERMLSFSNA